MVMENKRKLETIDVNEAAGLLTKKRRWSGVSTDSSSTTSSTVSSSTSDPNTTHLKNRKNGVLPNMWSSSEDKQLQAAVKKHGEKNWRLIADEVEGRDHLQCLQRWKKALRPGLQKGHWSNEEDQLLLSLVNQEPGADNKWVEIAAQIPGRNSKQCRERWSLNLDPSINRGPWSESEDELLLKLEKEYDGRWSIIARHMEGRTENSVKARFHSIQRQLARTRGWTKEEDEALIEQAICHDRDWIKIEKIFPCRSKGQLKKRFLSLAQKDPTIMVREKKKQQQQPAAAATGTVESEHSKVLDDIYNLQKQKEQLEALINQQRLREQEIKAANDISLLLRSSSTTNMLNQQLLQKLYPLNTTPTTFHTTVPTLPPQVFPIGAFPPATIHPMVYYPQYHPHVFTKGNPIA